ncbi:PREDICTED: uncharacterized protein LOC104820719 [Tarenaya hassleriana]|uniref:uncharacterized protein LOC104820719 n=1 Tax=Tarenaya hassleriana TaxID=28532 RepID=UPI00053C47AC|nr:PREDICTED: uncharacterized protein LOC104820719 [Tarenaya hassleriana]
MAKKKKGSASPASKRAGSSDTQGKSHQSPAASPVSKSDPPPSSPLVESGVPEPTSLPVQRDSSLLSQPVTNSEAPPPAAPISALADKAVHTQGFSAEDFPPLPRAPSRATGSTTPSPVPASQAPPQTYPWAQRLKASSRNLSRLATPQISEKGTPRIRVPSSVLLEASRNWTGYLVGNFLGIAPSGSKLLQILNPIWGRRSKIHVRRINNSSCLFHIPGLATKEWVLEVGLWRAMDVMFSVVEWSAIATFRTITLTSAPIWVNLTNIPAELYSLKGISYIASGIGEPLHTDKMRLDPLSVGEAKVKVEVQLDATLPQAIEIEDEQGSVITVNAAYPWILPKCINCGEFGHKLQSCPVRQSQPLQRVVETGTSIETPKTVDSQLTIKDVASASTSTLPTSVSLAPNTTNACDPQIADMNAKDSTT